VLGFSGCTGETGLLGAGFVCVMVVEKVEVIVEKVIHVEVVSDLPEVMTEVAGQ
jgi:hypothetical protein